MFFNLLATGCQTFLRRFIPAPPFAMHRHKPMHCRNRSIPAPLPENTRLTIKTQTYVKMPSLRRKVKGAPCLIFPPPQERGFMPGKLFADSFLCICLWALVQSAFAPPAFARRHRKPPPAEKTHYPHYSACQNMEEQPFAAKAPVRASKEDTEAGFCGPACSRFLSSFDLFQEAGEAVKEKEFAEKLRKRVSGSVQAKMFELRVTRACACLDSPNLKGCGPARKRQELLDLFKARLRRPANPEEKNAPFDIKTACRSKHQALKERISSLWPKMRESLSLSAPAVREQRIISNPSTWFDPSPSHKMSGFSSIEKLSGQEFEKAKSIAVSALVGAYQEESGGALPALERLFTKKQLAAALNEGKPLAFLTDKEVSPKNRRRMREALEVLWRESAEEYFKIIHQMPLLGWMRKGDPDEIPLALSIAEEKLERLLKKHGGPKAGLSPFLFSFEPIVEELLRESLSQGEDYCLIAERARLSLEKQKNTKENLIMTAMIAAIIPCFVPTPLSIAACAALEGGISFYDYSAADTEFKKSLGRALMGKELQDISEMKDQDKERAMALLFAPFIFLEVKAAMKAGNWLQKMTQQGAGFAGEKPKRRPLSKKEPPPAAEKEIR